ncbi:hypothetical protein HIM_11659 [Hirsutella minnesotensis 3608]|uniref:Uncharacterized protein n=1 Tax=Hirsutella minnesotensis 3608 TaxID=1043627 RepID=A0A0F7ZR39_9HYPO|nr:hypothetical protein HIM_11659 [Hirsutella minnesotensis 3608]
MSPIDTPAVSGLSSNGGSVSPRQTATPKTVTFELAFSNSPQYRARLPMRVQIYPHDTTDSIVTAVKEFYGLYWGQTGSKGVSFEDDNGNSLIARYENFRNNMVVYVRVIEEPRAASAPHPIHPAAVGSDVQRGRRKRAKLESSEMRLFEPPQMPAATPNSSVSPARRIENLRPSLPFVHPGHNPFTNLRPMQSPQNYHDDLGHSNMYATPASQGHRSPGSIGYASNGSGVTTSLDVLPTPDPTVRSCMSAEDKDVAIQLMRLRESPNISHGRTSASIMEDAFSGRADVASSTGASSDGESDSEREHATPCRTAPPEAGCSRRHQADI